MGFLPLFFNVVEALLVGFVGVEFLADTVFQMCECETVHDVPHVGWVIFFVPLRVQF